MAVAEMTVKVCPGVGAKAESRLMARVPSSVTVPDELRASNCPGLLPLICSCSVLEGLKVRGPVLSVPVLAPGATVPLTETGPENVPLPVKVAVLVMSRLPPPVRLPCRFSVPALTVAFPVKSPVAVMSNSPEPDFVKPPEPEREPASVVVPAEISMVVSGASVSGVWIVVEPVVLRRSVPVAVRAMVLPATV